MNRRLLARASIVTGVLVLDDIAETELAIAGDRPATPVPAAGDLPSAVQL